MNNIRRYTLAALVALFLGACTRDTQREELPEIYIDTPNYALGNDTLAIRVLAEAPLAVDTEIPLIYAGTSAQGVDFTADRLVFKAGQTEATLILRRIKESIPEANKELIVNLAQAPQGYRLGVMNFTTVQLLGSNGLILSFLKSGYDMSTLVDLTVSLKNMKGANHRAASDMQLAVEVDPSSTAVEGEHYRFVTGKYATVKRRSSEGTLSLQFLKKEEGKDKIVLKLSDAFGYMFGTHRTATVSIQGPYMLQGSWRLHRFENKDWWTDSYGWTTDVSKLPRFDEADTFTFTGTSHTSYGFNPQLTGDLRNYLIAPCRAVFKGEKGKMLHGLGSGKPETVYMAQYEFEKVNYLFSATKTQERTAILSFRIRKVDGEDMLECTIDDYTPTDFATEFADYGMTMEEAPFRLLFKRLP